MDINETDYDALAIESAVENATVRCANSEDFTRVPSGWTETEGVYSIISPLFDTDCVYGWNEANDAELECKDISGLKDRLPSFARFSGLDIASALKLLQCLPGHALADRQNSAPSLLEMLTACVRNPLEVTLFGYYVGPDRADERISVEGLIYRKYGDLQIKRFHDEECACDELWEKMIADFGWEECEVCTPDELSPISKNCEDNSGWRLWWD